MYHRSWAEINLSNLKYNLTNLYSFVKKDIFAVVKADAYGHNAVGISKLLEKFPFVKYLCVATAEEGKELRENYIKKPILVLGGILKEEIEIFNEYNLVPVVSDYYHLSLIDKLRTRTCHIKFDTGMHRLGFYFEDIPEVIEKLKSTGVNIEGIMSHFPSADTDPEFTKKQIEDFKKIIEILNKEYEVSPKYIHIQNSAGLVYKCDFCNSVRIGITLYGVKPFDNFPVNLKNVMSVKAKIIATKKIKKGSPVSYTGSFIADKDMRVGVISFGYADGLPRSLSNRGYVLIKGKKAKILGNITMDMTIIDISNISNINIGDEVIIIGNSEGNSITFEEIAKLTDTIPYEIMCGISKRVFRKFL